MTDLAGYGDLAEKLAHLKADEDASISHDDLPSVLDEVQPFGGLVFDTSYQRNLGWVGEGEKPFEVIDRVLGFDAMAEDDGYRKLGLWLIHFALSDRDWVGLTLTHPQTRAKWLYVEKLDIDDHVAGLQRDGRQRYRQYNYWPAQTCRHPFADLGMAPFERASPQERPYFAFGWSLPDPQLQYDVKSADQIILQASVHGIAALGALLLDFANPDLGTDEINFEPPHIGFGATAPRSIEARFWRPGSLCFPANTLNNLILGPWPQT